MKDFAVHLEPEEGETIRKMPLGACIGQFLEDSSLKACAERATWLGNDETHYVRRWEDKDIEDLKLLVHLTVNWTENGLLTEQYEAEMPAGGKQDAADNAEAQG